MGTLLESELNKTKNRNMKKSLFILVLLVCNNIIFSQDLSAKWSEKIQYDSYKFGFYDKVVGSNSKSIYTLFSRFSSYKRLRLVAFDKVTMKKTCDVAVYGFKENQAEKKLYKGLAYKKTVVFENQIYVFWIREDKQKDELFVQSYDANLKKLKPLKKIYEIKTVEGAKKRAELFIMANKDLGEKILIGGELSGAKGNAVKIEYKVLNADFTFSNANQVELPLVITGRSDELSSGYEFGDDGNLHIRFDKTLMIVKLETGEQKTFKFEFSDKKLFDFDYIIDESGVRLFGLFCDLKKDKRGSDNHGIFSAVIDTKTMAYKSNNFEYFTKEQLDRLFAKDKEDRKDSRLFASKKSKKSEDNSMASNYGIEFVQTDGKDLVLFCSRMYNYQVCSTNSQGQRTCNYYCQKDNVTGFKISPEGKIIWATNLDRRITYGGWNVYDINVMKRGDQFYVAYGSTFDKDAVKKGCFSSKSKKDLRDKFEYAIFDAKTGNPLKKELVINKPNTPRAERKKVSSVGLEVHDNTFYIMSSDVHLKRAYMAGCVVPCFIYFYMFHPYFKTGSGQFGTITTAASK